MLSYARRLRSTKKDGLGKRMWINEIGNTWLTPLLTRELSCLRKNILLGVQSKSLGIRSVLIF